MSNQPTRSNPDAKRRGQALAGAVAGSLVVIVLFGVFFAVKDRDRHKAAAAAAHPVASATQPAEDPSADQGQADPQAQPSPPAAPNVQIPPALSKRPTVTAGTGTVTKIKITPIVQGTGPVVRKGQTLTANYVVATYKDGKVMDSSWSRGQPFSTPIGVGQVIRGWDESIPGQHLGSRLQIDVPAALAYGAKQGDLRFVVDLLAAQ